MYLETLVTTRDTVDVEALESSFVMYARQIISQLRNEHTLSKVKCSTDNYCRSAFRLLNHDKHVTLHFAHCSLLSLITDQMPDLFNMFSSLQCSKLQRHRS